MPSEPSNPAPCEPFAPVAPCEPSPWLLWQLADSAFPTGGFAHSFGLEAACQAGEVPDDDALRRFVQDILSQTGHGQLPLLAAAHESPVRLSELDGLCDLFLVNPVANRASRIQGRAFVATCARVWPTPATASVAAGAAVLCGHHAPLAGAALAAIGVPLEAAQRLLLYTTARGVLSAAVRLGLVGPYAAQQLQVACAPDLDAVLARCASLRDPDITQTAPLLDLLQARHDRLYSRLFQS